MPASRSRRIRSSTSATWRTQIAAVGSSISTMLGLRQPGAGDGDRLALTARHLAHEIARPGLGLELGEQFARALRHRAVVEPAERPEPPLDLAPEKDIGGGGQIVAEREVLIDDLDALLARLDGLMKMHRLAVEDDLAGGRGKVAGDDLDQGRLAGAVVAHQAEDLAASSVMSTSFSAWIAPKCFETAFSSSIGNPATSLGARTRP